MKKQVLTALLAFLLLTPSLHAQKLVKVWSTSSGLQTPESALYYEPLDVIFVSNINGNSTEKDGNGFITQMLTDGSIYNLHWVEGLNAPKGQAIHKGKLYVADIDELVEIDIARAEITNRYPAEGAIFLNDVAACDNGWIFVTDTRTNKIHILKDGELSVWMESEEFSGINGLFTEKGKLYIGSQVIHEADIQTKELKTILEGAQGIDGLIKMSDGNFLFSNWVGRIFITKGDEIIKLLDSTAEQINTADIDYIPRMQLVLVPTFNDNKVEAYKLR